LHARANEDCQFVVADHSYRGGRKQPDIAQQPAVGQSWKRRLVVGWRCYGGNPYLLRPLHAKVSKDLGRAPAGLKTSNLPVDSRE
jgi:hypothetical protein